MAPPAALGFPVPTDDEIGPEMVAKLKQFPPLNIQRYPALEPECFEGWNRWLHGMPSSFELPAWSHLTDVAVPINNRSRDYRR